MDNKFNMVHLSLELPTCARTTWLNTTLSTFVAARLKTYTEFDAKRNETDETKIKEQLELANQVASLLRHNLAQAVQVEGKDDIYCKCSLPMLS